MRIHLRPIRRSFLFVELLYNNCYMKPDVQTKCELLKKYYAYDEANKTFIIALHYEKVSDILNNEVQSVSSTPLMSEEFLSKITGILEGIPKGYHADIKLTIDDYEGYDEKIIMESFNDMLEFGRLKYNSSSQNKFYKVAILLVVGLVLLFTGIFAKVEEWWGIFETEELIGELLINFLEISGWVFCWEAVSILFIENNDDMKQGLSIISKLNSVTLYNKNNKSLINEEYDQIQKHIYRVTPIKRAGLLLLVFSGFAFIGLGSMIGIRQIPNLFIVTSNNMLLLIALLNWVWIALIIFSGLFAIKLYLGKEKYRIPAATLAVINLGFTLFAVIFSAINGIDISLIVINIISGIIEVAYCLGFFFTLDYKKKN